MQKFLLIITFVLSALFHSQENKNVPLIADFTYLLKGKVSKSDPNYIREELFSLQVLQDRAFFISEKALQFDSIFQSEFQRATVGGVTNIDFRGKSFPKTKFPYTIIQTHQNIQYFERVGMSNLSYKETPIDNWTLIDESNVIATLHCKKASINYKGRNWIAWYSTDLPLPYGPYKFTGLPGLIIKISDETGAYDFELVKTLPNEKLKGKILTVSTLRYENAQETTWAGLEKAKKNHIGNMMASLESMGTTIVSENNDHLRSIQKQKQQSMMDENSLELHQQ